MARLIPAFIICLVATSCTDTQLQAPRHEAIVPAKSAFQRSDDEWRRVVQSLNALRQGETYDAVLARVGRPDSSQSVAQPDANERPVGTSVKYFRYRGEPGTSVHAPDQFVELFFDQNDELKWMIPHGVSDVRQLRTSSGR